MVVVGQRARIARMVCAKCSAPPSARSSRSTEVIDDVGKPELEGRLGDVLRLVRIERAGHAGLDVAERAGAGAGVAHDHEGGVLLVPALADIRAARLLAHRDEAVLLDDPAGVGIAARIRRAHPDPVRLRRRQRIRPVHLFRVTRAQRRG